MNTLRTHLSLTRIFLNVRGNISCTIIFIKIAVSFFKPRYLKQANFMERPNEKQVIIFLHCHEFKPRPRCWILATSRGKPKPSLWHQSQSWIWTTSLLNEILFGQHHQKDYSIAFNFTNMFRNKKVKKQHINCSCNHRNIIA